MPSDRMQPFTVDIPDSVLTDLRDRLARTRWPNEACVAPWTYGTSLAYMQQVCAHWHDHYDWRRAEARINAHENYLVTLGDKKVHVLIEPGSGSAPRTLVLTHGWPGSIFEYLDIVGPLAHPEKYGGRIEDAFTVILPSLPGYGFSEPPEKPVPPREVAALWHELMTEVLGCDSYFAQGGDWGAIITSWLALDYPDTMTAMHLNLSAFMPTVADMDMSEIERAWMSAYLSRRAKEVAYHQINGTKPQTLAYGLQDSPSGCAAWVLEKFRTWSSKTADPMTLPFGTDHLLDNVMMYWLNGSNAPAWLYCSVLDGTGRSPPEGQKVDVPTGFLLFPDDIALPAPRDWLDRSYADIRQYRVADTGGHFAAFESPDIIIEDLRTFFRNFR